MSASPHRRFEDTPFAELWAGHSADFSPYHAPDHAAKVRDICAQVAAKPQGARISVAKSTPTHQISDLSWKSKCHRVNISAMTDVLSIDKDARLVTVEGGVTMGELTARTLEEGFIPLVVPEYTTFTVSGLCAGDGIQVSSHRHGVFTSTCASFEVVLGDGRAVITDPFNEPDLFWVLMRSSGTVGIVTAAQIRLMPALPLVRSVYTWYSDMHEYTSAVQAAVGKPVYLEGVVFAKDAALLISSDFVTSKSTGDAEYHPGPLPECLGNEWYYQYVRKTKERGITSTVIPTWEFVHRSVRGTWWIGEDYLSVTWLFNAERRYMREAADKPDILLAQNPRAPGFPARFVTNLPIMEREKMTLNQDSIFTLDRLEEGLDFVMKNIGVYPLWVCPARNNMASLPVFSKPEDVTALNNTTGVVDLVDIGIYGGPTSPLYRWPSTVRQLQKLCDVPTTWGLVYLSAEEFDPIFFQRSRYEAARAKYHCDAFLHVDEKFRAFVPENTPDRKMPMFWRWRMLFQSLPGPTAVTFLLTRVIPAAGFGFLAYKLATSIQAWM